VSAASWTHPELIGRPRRAGSWIAQLHVGAAALTANMDVDVGHSRILAHWSSDIIAGVVPAIVLAAGLSTRMRRTKATLPLPGGDTFLGRIVRTFAQAGIAEVVVVVGHDWERVADGVAAAGLSPRFVLNARYMSGQLSSLLAGLDAIDREEVSGTLLTLVDVPLVSASTVRAVVQRFEATGAAIVRPVRGEAHGHPVLVSRALFAALRAADPSVGAKPIVRAHASPEGSVEITDDPGAFLDIDTPEEYARIEGIAAGDRR
jgi:molybdenum cofactor cytidylyltransferase